MTAHPHDEAANDDDRSWYGRMPTKAVPLTDAWIALRRKERMEQAGGLIELHPDVRGAPLWIKALAVIGALFACGAIWKAFCWI